MFDHFELFEKISGDDHVSDKKSREESFASFNSLALYSNMTWNTVDSRFASENKRIFQKVRIYQMIEEIMISVDEARSDDRRIQYVERNLMINAERKLLLHEYIF